MSRQRLPSLLAVATATAVAVPALAVLSRALGVQGSTAAGLARADLLPLIATTAGLAVLASGIAVGIGLLGSWIVERRSFPGRGLAVVLLASPLVVPPYLVAQLWLEISEPGKALHAALGGRLFGHLLSSAGVIGLCTSPLCFLVLRAAVARLDRTHEDAAATLGLGRAARFWKLVVPSLRPAWLAGLCLVSLYACADFGAVSALGTKTFTREIFFQLDLNMDRGAARDASAVLSLVLVGLALPLFLGDRLTRGAARYEHATAERRPVPPRPLRGVGLIAFWCFVLAVAGPTAIFVVGRSLFLLQEVEQPGLLWGQARTALLHSGTWAATAATVAVLGALSVGWAASRLGRLHELLVPAASLGFVLPGPVVALGTLIAITGFAPLGAAVDGLQAVLEALPLGTPAVALVLAWVVRFLPEALQAISSGLEQAPRQLEEAARTLGMSPSRAVLRVTLPIVAASIATGWVFVFTAAMRELPAALLLKPLGTRTLSYEIWTPALDERYADMAPAALLLVLFSVPAVALLLRSARSRPPHSQAPPC